MPLDVVNGAPFALPEGAQPDADSAASRTDRPGDRRLIVHLVHGTWPEGLAKSLWRSMRAREPYTPAQGSTCWFQAGHPFRQALETGLAEAGFEADLRPFVWSGANGFAARATAAEEFVAHLVAGIRDATRQVIVAHSHGGTVAMLALQMMAQGATPRAFTEGGSLKWAPMRRTSGRSLELDVEDIVELPADRVRAGVKSIDLVTLATPFLRVERFGSGTNLWNAFAVLWMTAFMALAVWVARQYGQDRVGTLSLVVMFAGGLLARWIASAQAFAEGRIVDTQACRFVGRRIQCLRGLADEAELGISAGIIGCNFVRTALVAFGRTLGRIPAWLFAAVLLAVIGLLTFAILAGPGETILGWVYAAGGAAAGLIGLLALGSMLQSLLGVELAAAGFGLLTTVESSPDAGRHQIEVVTLPATQDSAEGLRHAVYLHPDCVPRIVAGLAD